MAERRDELVARAEALVPVLRERAPAADDLRRLPDETVADLVEAGFVRATAPKRLGGDEIDYRTMMEIVAATAHGCGSTAWVLCNLMSCTFKLALWPQQAQEEVWRDSLDTLLTGALIFPCGRAKPVDGGYRLSGRWPFCSGIDHAAWNFFAAMVEREGNAAEFRIFLVPKNDYQILDTWHTSGLRGTGSNDVSLEEAFVPEYRTIDAAGTRDGTSPGHRLNTGVVYRVPLFAMFFSWVGAAVLGIAEAAVSDYLTGARTRMARYSGAKLADFAAIQMRVAEAKASVDTARRLYLQNCDEATAIVEAGGLPTAEQRARYRAEGALAARLCARAVDTVFKASGGGALYDTNPLSRAHRDIHAATAHVTQVWDVNATTYGRAMLGIETDNPLL